jgi:hypothetical protein
MAYGGVGVTASSAHNRADAHMNGVLGSASGRCQHTGVEDCGTGHGMGSTGGATSGSPQIYRARGSERGSTVCGVRVCLRGDPSAARHCPTSPAVAATASSMAWSTSGGCAAMVGAYAGVTPRCQWCVGKPTALYGWVLCVPGRCRVGMPWLVRGMPSWWTGCAAVPLCVVP